MQASGGIWETPGGIWGAPAEHYKGASGGIGWCPMRHMVKDVVFTNDQITKSLEALFGFGILGICIYIYIYI